MRSKLLEADVPGALHALAAIDGRDDLVPELARITTPALVVHGDEDGSLPPRRGRRLAEHLPDARYIELAGTGHLSALENPRGVAEAVASFLEVA